jgi:hypothetical protein
VEEEELIEAYLTNSLSDSELIAFEERLENDKDFFDSVQLEKQLFESLDEESLGYISNKEHTSVHAYKTAFESDDTKDIKKAIIKAEEAYNQKPNRKLYTVLYAAAASIVLFVSIFSWNKTHESPSNLYAEYIELSTLPSLAERGNDSADVLLHAQRQFENKSYTEVISILQEAIKDTTDHRAVKYVYLGIAQMESHQFDDAIHTFETLAQSNFIDAPLAHWYMALLFLKKDDSKQAEIQLKKIIKEDLYNKTKAEELLRKIENLK